MKKAISLLLALVICFSLFACGSGNDTAETNSPEASEKAETAPSASDTTDETQPEPQVDEEKRLESIEMLRAYVEEHGEAYGSVTMYTFDTGAPDTKGYLLANQGVLYCFLEYSIGTLNTSTTKSTRNTALYLCGYKNQIDGTYYVYQNNTITAGGVEMGASGGINLHPATFTVDSEIELVDFTPTENNTGAQLTDEFIFNTTDGLHFVLESLSVVLSESNLGLTLADFGFLQYEIDENRKSDIRSGAYVKDVWSMNYYVDNFNATTDQWYISNPDNIEGTFNNSMASKATLGVKLIVDAENISLFLYEYGNQQVKSFSSLYETKYNIITKKEDGTQENLTGTLYPSGDRIFIDQAYTNVVLHLLQGECTFQIYLENASRTGTNYLFTVDCSNFAEIYQNIE